MFTADIKKGRMHGVNTDHLVQGHIDSERRHHKKLPLHSADIENGFDSPSKKKFSPRHTAMMHRHNSISSKPAALGVEQLVHSKSVSPSPTNMQANTNIQQPFIINISKFDIKLVGDNLDYISDEDEDKKKQTEEFKDSDLMLLKEEDLVTKHTVIDKGI